MRSDEQHHRALGLHWRETGAGRPLVFLHGMADSHRSFVPIAEGLPRRRVMLLDLPGHGLSDGVADAPCTPEWYAAQIAAWCDALGLDEFDLVGHSYGGAVAQLLTVEHVERVRTLTLIAPGGLGPEVGVGLRLLTLPGATGVVRPFLSQGMKHTMRAVGVTPEHAEISAWYAARPDAADVLARTARAVIDLRGQTRQSAERAHEPESLPPTALLWGDRDRVLPALQARRAQSWLEGAEVRLYEGVDHWPHLERTQQVASDLTELLEREDRRRVRVAFDRVPKRRPTWRYRLGRWIRSVPRRIAAWVRGLLGSRRPRLTAG